MRIPNRKPAEAIRIGALLKIRCVTGTYSSDLPHF